MKQTQKLLLTILFTALYTFTAFSQEKTPNKDQRYIFFLHNKFIEENDLNTAHPEYGKAEYNEILASFRKDNFIVFSEKRKKNTNAADYAEKIVKQIKNLLKKGISPSKITVIGTSKGGYIAQFVSTYLANPDVNFVFIGCFRDVDIEEIPDINFCGNILTIYEKSDIYGVSAVKRKETSKLKVNHFKEIELNTNLKHGFLYKALDEWIVPSKKWANGNYELN
ncbi:alpha/beta hydrolase [Flavobacterium johnsoniae]|uniref:alpha/beta hydrolase n=1 Tax=Flavobacterium johnsoniae TaxID=986 RepID=UPI000EB2B4A3|nr:alpha/beta hydrolase [Flavobacterium johnsoniae]